MQKLKVQVRNGFSDRNKIKVENTMIQYTHFDKRSRTALINGTDFIMNKYFNMDNFYGNIKLQNTFKSILGDLYNEEVDFNKTYYPSVVMKSVYQTIREDSYDAVLTLVEFFADLMFESMRASDIYDFYNDIFTAEFVGYRFVNKQITSITDETEIQEIELAQETNIDPVKIHLDKALGYLSDRTSPDYENSIKESISGVEAMCSSIVGKSDSLGKTLNKLEQSGVVIHGALKTAFSQLYGWTSDANGIRHAGDIGGASSTFDEAKFMLVSCCAFINYLKSSMKD